MNNRDIIDWLLNGDVSIQYQTQRDLLNSDQQYLQDRIENEGWGAELLSLRKKNGHWGQSFYQPKWISTHYTLLDLKNLGIAPECKEVKQTIELILEQNQSVDGGINVSKRPKVSDVCVNGMFLNYASYFQTNLESLQLIIDFLITSQMKDGGFNCNFNQQGATHSSLHSTISVLEGFHEYSVNKYNYRLSEIRDIKKSAQEFILQHKLYRSDRTNKIIDKRMIMLSYPSRWRYDILRALDYFQNSKTKYDERMHDALNVLEKKKRKDGRWPVQAKHPGQTHFDMEKTGEPSRWNTLRALRVFKRYNIN